jgi:hypothetical protein
VLLAALTAVGVWRGLTDAGGWQLGWQAGYDQGGNTWRVAKSGLEVLLLLPLLWRAVATDAAAVCRRWAAGVWTGLLCVGLLVLWERALYAGGLDFTWPYRTSAWFWDMHVGGGAIDAYLAMAVPVAMWAVWAATTPGRWCAAAAVLLLAVFAALTTYSRGVYLVVAGAALLLWATVAVLRWNPAPDLVWRRRALRCLWGVVALEALLVLVLSTFMASRLGESDEDAYRRWSHWVAGASLVQTPAERWLGLGLGRLPARYSAQVPGGGFPGGVAVSPGDSPAGVTLLGPAPGVPVAGHRFGLTQRVTLAPGGRYTVRLRLVADQPTQVMARVCERHLLYDLRCQWRRATVPATGPEGVERQLVLRGPAFSQPGEWGHHRLGMFTLSVLGEGQSVGVLEVALQAPQGEAVLQNTRFEQGLHHWMPAAQGHFLAWHLDNLYLETWVERGWLGALAFGVGVCLVLVCVVAGLRRRNPWALVGWLVLASALVLGLVISYMEVPRVAFMLLFWLFVGPAGALVVETPRACNINSISPVCTRAGKRE